MAKQPIKSLINGKIPAKVLNLNRAITSRLCMHAKESLTGQDQLKVWLTDELTVLHATALHSMKDICAACKDGCQFIRSTGHMRSELDGQVLAHERKKLCGDGILEVLHVRTRRQLLNAHCCCQSERRFQSLICSVDQSMLVWRRTCIILFRQRLRYDKLAIFQVAADGGSEVLRACVCTVK